MNKCKSCEKESTWNCISCSELLCDDHKRIHINDDRAHNYIKINQPVSDNRKQKAKESFKTKIEIIDQWSREIIKSRELICASLLQVSNQMLEQLQQEKSKSELYKQLLDQEIPESKLAKILKEGETEPSVGYQRAELINKLIEQEKKLMDTANEELARNSGSHSSFLTETHLGLVTSLMHLVEKRSSTVTGTIRRNSWIYDGEIKDMLPHGKGVCTYINPGQSSGEQQSRGRDGKRKYNINCDNPKIYEGEWMHGRREGKGKCEYFNGNVYDGEWKSNAEEGTGNCVFKHGKFKGGIYQGEWKNGKIEGDGEMKYKNGDIYNGYWIKSKRCGKGIINTSDGHTYVGNWKKNNKNGEGTMTYNNGDIYKGSWKDGEREGYGEYFHNSGELRGDTYKGAWKKGKKHGKGTYISPHTFYYEGDWVSDKKEGKGKLKYTGSDEYDEYDGGWVNDMKDGHGRLKMVNGDNYDGLWRNDLKHGRGTLTTRNGKVCQGLWEKNQYREE